MGIKNCKYCPKCEKIKTLDKFHKNSSKSHGIHAICKECKSSYDRSRSHLRNSTTITIDNCSGCTGRKRSDRKYCKLCEVGPKLPKHFHDFQMEQSRMIREGRHNYGPKGRYRTLRTRSVNKGFVEILDYEVFQELIKQDCVYCGDENIGSGVGLDRLDNTIGYVEANVVSCCGSCNQVRGHNLTVMETIVAMEAVVKLRNSKK